MESHEMDIYLATIIALDDSLDYLLKEIDNVAAEDIQIVDGEGTGEQETV